jgi:hypothetical protein
MRLRGLVMSGAVMLSLAACASTPDPAAVQPEASSAPASLAGHDWFLRLDDERPGLVYGAENSDDIWLTLTCEPGTAVLDLTQAAVEPHPIRVESGGDIETYPSSARPSEMDDLLLTARAGLKDPVFQRFRQVGWLATWTDGRRATMAPQPGSAGRIESFFAACD